jgi:acyl-coenzyme A synthetase/AMP-(fatty) acid ligase
MAEFKVPDVVYIADALPRTATGKIQRRHMVAAFAGGE